MKKSFDGRFVALFAGSALMLMGGVAEAGIANTKHNLSSSSVTGNKFSGTAEICVFCHTPHGADTSAVVPLWNKALPLSTTFTTYASLGTSSLTGQIAPVGSVSIACLSCHDGVGTVNNMINAPGSGGYNSAGANMAGTWIGSLAATSKIPAGITNTGQDLRNDHPVGVQYAGGGYVSSTNLAANNSLANGTGLDADFVVPTAKSAGATGPVQFWVEVSGTGVGKQKTDLLLYTRTEASSALGGTITGGAQPYVECATCHDPHTETATFLRKDNAASALCLACHVK